MKSKIASMFKQLSPKGYHAVRKALGREMDQPREQVAGQSQDFDEIARLLRREGYLVAAKHEARDFDRYLDQNEFRYILWLDRIFEKIRTVPGHIVEVGVARGRNAVLFGHLVRLNGEDAIRNYYGFDTFDGYVAEDLRRSPHLSEIEWKNTTKAFVEKRLKSCQLSDICHVFQGSIEQEAPIFLSRGHRLFQPNSLQISLLYIDCNAYNAAKFSMNFFKQYMAPGGVICIDEKVQGGETEALREFCLENGLSIRKDPGPFGMPAHVVMET